MPELPEVSYMCSRISPHVKSSKIVDVQVIRGKYLSDDGAEKIVGSVIYDVWRAGKYMLFEMNKGTLVCHNAMSGFWDTSEDPWTFDYVEGKRTSTEKDVRVQLTVEKDRKRDVVRFHDARLFGTLKFFEGLSPNLVPSVKKLGPEAISTETMLRDRPVMNALDAVLLNEKKPIKSLLMDQERIAGVGNIYAAEALWRARVSPFRPGDDLVTDELMNIQKGLRDVLKRALLRDLRYDDYLKIYRRKKCPRCGSTVNNDKLDGRSTYWCKSCQG